MSPPQTVTAVAAAKGRRRRSKDADGRPTPDAPAPATPTAAAVPAGATPTVPVPGGIDFADFVSRAPVCMHQLDPQGNVLWMNDAGLAMLGYAAQELVGRNARDLHGRGEALEATLADLAAGRAVENHRAALRRRDGTTIEVLFSANVEGDPAAGAWRSRWVVRDITDLALAEAERVATSRQLQQRERQQALVARLGAMALAGADLRAMAGVAAAEVAALYGQADCGIGELTGPAEYRMVAGTGWMQALMGRALPYESDPASQSAFHMATVQAVVIPDLEAETRFRPAARLRENGVRSGVCGVIPGPERPWGTFGLFGRQPGQFGPDDARFVESLLQVLASAVRRTGTEAMLSARVRQQDAVARLGSRALSTPELPAVIDLALKEVATTLAVRHVGLLRFHSDRTVSMEAGTGWPDGFVGLRVPLDPGGECEYLLATGKPAVYQAGDPAPFQPNPSLAAFGFHSGMTVLVPGPERPWGLLGVHSTDRKHFTPDDVTFLESVAQILASALRRSHTEASLAARIRQQAALARLGQEAVRRDLRELLAIAAREIAIAVDAEFCKVLELDQDGRVLLLRAGVGWREGLVGSATVPADTHSQAGYALRSDRAVIVDDLAAETRFETAPLLRDHGIVSGMSVIVRGLHAPYGVVGVHSRQRRAFSKDDIDVLETAAALLAAAVERHRVQDELRRHRAHLEEEVAERTRQLAASNRELEAFSYSVSHDLRAPLRTITGYSTLLMARHGPTLGTEGNELLTGVRKSAERLGRLIDDLLDLSRVQRVDLVREKVDLSALCQQTLANLAAGEPGRAVDCHVQAGLVAEGDARLLGMLLENLLGNAWKFTRRTERARIEVTREGPESDPVFVVRDNGAGLDMAYAGKLFQPFQRLHRPSEFDGTGIGLATVKRIVDRHNGRVWVEGRPGAGASFYFTIGR